MKFKIKLPKINFITAIITWSKYLRLVIVLLTIAIFSFLSYFLYKNVYLTVTQSQEIILLKQEVAPETINLNEVKSVIDAINAKDDLDINWQEVNNPFRWKKQTSTVPPPAPPSTPSLNLVN